MEQAKSMPWGAVWDMLCVRADAPPAETWLANVTRHEITVLSKRG
jgi:L-rhamnose isomerase